jgi:ornithine cyclodeaminase/alanine dehydrogenase-like protein (mu-crystallin family)
MLILTRDDVQRLLSVPQAIEMAKMAFVDLSTGRTRNPVRTRFDIPEHNGLLLCMPGYFTFNGRMAVKLVSVYQENHRKSLPLIHGIVILYDAATGKPKALIEGSSLTALRTGAASGVATQFLARADAQMAAIFGAGVQARTQLLAVCATRPISRVWIYDPTPRKTTSFIIEMEQKLGNSVQLIEAKSPTEAIREADVICTATTSPNPVFDGSDIKAGTHVNAIGSFTPDNAETDLMTIRRASKIVVDTKEGVLAEAGDLLKAFEAKIAAPSDIYAEIGEIAAGLKKGRENADEITYFKSVGTAVLDVAVGDAIYELALHANLGTDINIFSCS